MSEPIDVYLLAGQSNMSGAGQPDTVPPVLQPPHPSAMIYFAPLNEPGNERLDRPHVRRWSPLAPGSGSRPGCFGPELSFGHTVAARTDDRRIALIKSERGGSSLLTDWRPLDLEDPTTFSNIMLRDAAQAMEDLIEDGYNPRFAGFLWYQGEAETRGRFTVEEAMSYTEVFSVLLERIADDLNDGQDYPKVLFRVHPHNAVGAPHYDIVRGQLMAIADQDPLGAWVNVDDLHYPDQLHPDGPSLLIAGDRAAAAMMDIHATLPNDQALLPPGEGGSQSETQEHERSDAPAVEVATEPEAEPAPMTIESDAAPEPELTATRPLPNPLPEGEGATRQTPNPKPQPPNPKPTPINKPDQTRVLALMNQKGGVGKTTSAVNIGAALANLGLNVLCIDLDPQAHLTLSLGIEPDEIEKSNYDLLTDKDTTAMETVRYTARDDKRLAVLPAETNLAGVESELSDMIATGLAQTILRNKCKDLVKEFDYVLIDCPPSLGLLTINALTMANEIVVPMQAHFLALQGMTKLFETIGMVRQGINPNLTVAGVVLCMHEGNTLLANEVITELNGFFESARGTDQPWANGQVFQPPVRRNIKLAEAPSFGQSVHAYAPDSNGAQDYLAVARSIAAG